MSDLAEKILEAARTRLDAERSKTRDVWHSYCPTCGERADRYSIGDLEWITDMMKVPVKLLPCGHVVVWDTIRREPGTVCLADDDLVRLYKKDIELVQLHKHAASFYPCDTLRILARGYGVQP